MTDTDEKIMFVGLFVILPLFITWIAIVDSKQQDKEIKMCESFCAPKASYSKKPFDDPRECYCKGPDGLVFQNPKEWKNDSAN